MAVSCVAVRFSDQFETTATKDDAESDSLRKISQVTHCHPYQTYETGTLEM